MTRDAASSHQQPDRDSADLDALLGAAVDAIIVADTSGKILRCNPAAYRTFGYDADELLGRNISVLMPERESRRHDAYMSHHLATGEERIIGRGRELEGLRKDGSVFPLHLSVGRSERDGHVQFVAILHDLTRRRAAELALERSRRLEAIGQMTGGVAHDFNNLLTLIIGNLELAMQKDVTPDVRGLIYDGLEAAEVGADLTRRLLTFARQSRLAPEVLGTNDLVERIAGIARHGIRAGQRIDLSLAADSWPVHVDPTQLQSAILNLVRNSVDAIEGEGVILIGSENIEVDDTFLAREIDATPGNYVRLTVSDTGAGMTPEVRQKAFEPFFTTKPPGEGTGLGLATVYGFVRQSGGHITIYSEPGQGTTVSIYLPAAADVAVQRRKPAPEFAALPGHGELVLVVEDNPAVRRMTATRLNALGYGVLEAGTVEEANAAIDGGTEIALVFSDMMMPGGQTGLDLAWRLRRERPDLPVLLTTGYAGEMTDAEIVDGFALLRKPYRQEELAIAVTTVMARAGTAVDTAG